MGVSMELVCSTEELAGCGRDNEDRGSKGAGLLAVPHYCVGVGGLLKNCIRNWSTANPTPPARPDSRFMF